MINTILCFLKAETARLREELKSSTELYERERDDNRELRVRKHEVNPLYRVSIY